MEENPGGWCCRDFLFERAAVPVHFLLWMRMMNRIGIRTHRKLQQYAPVGKNAMLEE